MMASVDVFSTVDRGTRTYTRGTYGYFNGYYDRREQLFYGFAEVASTRSNGAMATTLFLNGDYYTRGMTRGSELKGVHAGTMFFSCGAWLTSTSGWKLRFEDQISQRLT